MLTSATTSRSTLSPHTRGVCLMLTSTACFTANVLLTRVLAQTKSVDVYLLCCARFVTGLALVLLLFRRELQLSHLFRRRKLAERGIVGAAGTCAFYVTIVHLGAGRATFISTTYVVIAALLAIKMLGERFRALVAAGGVVALTGLALLTNAFGADAHASVYDLLAVAVAVSSAWIVVTIRQLHATETTATIFSAQCVYGLVLCALPATVHWQPLPATAWGLIAIASTCAGAGQITMTHAFRHLPVAEGSLLQMLVPIGIGVGSMAFFDERFTPTELLGASLIVAGTAVTALRPELRRRRNAS